MRVENKHIRETKKRNHRVTSLNLEEYQYHILAKNGLILSSLVRDLLDEFFTKNFNEDIRAAKAAKINVDVRHVKKPKLINNPPEQCEACLDFGYLEVTQDDNKEYLCACDSCDYFGIIGTQDELNERARKKAVKDGLKLNAKGQVI